MIPLTRLNGGVLYLNEELVASVEEHHDTVLTLTDGKCLVVAESADEVVAAIVHFRAEVLATSERLLRAPAGHPAGHPHGTAKVLSLHPGGQ